jgi:hypothetical protein
VFTGAAVLAASLLVLGVGLLWLGEVQVSAHAADRALEAMSGSSKQWVVEDQ